MQIKCVFSLDSSSWEKYPYAMAEKVAEELRQFIEKNIILNEKTEFKPAIGTFHDLQGVAIGEMILEEDNE